MRRAVFSILVDNSSGVLSRVAGLFSRRGYNIDSLTVGETLDPKLSRMTITVTGDDDVLEQIEKQLGKLIDVKEIVELPHDESVCRELVLIKVLCTREERQQITTMADIYWSCKRRCKFKINIFYYFRRYIKCQRLRFIISQIVTYHYLMVRQLLSSVTAVRDMHMH